MMFATDLDRTIVYSKKALEDLGTPLNERLLPVEKKEGEALSYMTARSMQLLKEVADEILLVPVTTRTTAQFNRIFIFTQQIPIKYAITFNGAEILHGGKPLPDWRESIQEKVKKNCSSHDELKEILKGNLFQLNGQLKSAEGLFIYYLLNEKLTENHVAEIRKDAAERGWKVSYQGRKLYFMPSPISKGEAVSFVKSREGISTLIGAGDSLLDEDFLMECHHSFIPSHGELAGNTTLSSFFTTDQQGIYAGEELLEKIRKLIAQ